MMFGLSAASKILLEHNKAAMATNFDIVCLIVKFLFQKEIQ